MKTRILLIALLLMTVAAALTFSLSSCDKIAEATQLKIKHELPDRYFTIDSVSYLKTERILFSETMNANLDSIVNSNSGMLGDVNFYLVRLTVVSPAWVNLGWLNSARVAVTPPGGIPFDVATTGTINAANRSVDFVIKNLDQASGINGPFQLTVYGDLKGPLPAAQLYLHLESGVQVTINPF
jgi:hypothetical protein